jgi:hypothetical protein
VARTKKSPEQRKVSLWLAVKKPSIKKMQGVDILKDLCGVRYYDLDDQAIGGRGRFSQGHGRSDPRQTVLLLDVSRGSDAFGRRAIEQARLRGTGAVRLRVQAETGSQGR